MKKEIILLFLFIFTSINSQTLRGIYIKQSLEAIGGDKELNEKSKIPEIYEYIYSNGFSLQTLITSGGTTVDTILKKNEQYDFIQKSTVKTSLLEKSIIFKNFKEELLEQNYTSDKKETFIRDTFSKFDWTVTNETKIIDGFKCKKATTEMTTYGYKLPITAWFCEDVPINDGPITLNGLPGFVFEASSGKLFNFKFKNFAFDKKEIVKIEPIKTNASPKTTKEVEDSRN